MEPRPNGADTHGMKKAIRALGVIATSVVALGALGLAFTFGDCAGWKGTGTCPRNPLWDWEVFNIVFLGTMPVVIAIRLARTRVLRTLIEAAVAAAVVAAAVVAITGI